MLFYCSTHDEYSPPLRRFVDLAGSQLCNVVPIPTLVQTRLPMRVLIVIIIAVCWAIAILYIALYRRAKRIEATRLQLLADLPEHDFFDLCLTMLRKQRQWQIEKAPPSALSSVNYRGFFADKIYLIAIKHRLGYQVSPNVIDDLSAAVRLHEGDCYGVLLTEESVQSTVRQTALAAQIELIDGPIFWNLVKGYVPADYVDPVVATVRRSALIQMSVITLLSVALCLLILSQPQRQLHSDLEPPTRPTPTQHEELGLSPPEIQARTTPTMANDAQSLQEHRITLTRQLILIPGITHAAWISRTTLAIERNVVEDTLWPEICRLINQYPDLQPMRVQIDARPNTNEPVHWRQCSPY